MFAEAQRILEGKAPAPDEPKVAFRYHDGRIQMIVVQKGMKPIVVEKTLAANEMHRIEVVLNSGD